MRRLGTMNKNVGLIFHEKFNQKYPGYAFVQLVNTYPSYETYPICRQAFDSRKFHVVNLQL